MARKQSATGTPKQSRTAQVKQTYRMAKRVDPRIGLITLAAGLAVLAVFVVIGLVAGRWWFWLLLGFPFALLAATVVFGRRAEAAAYKQIEGQPGAALAALGTLRRGWTVTEVVAVNRHQDVVHRVTGRPGIVLVGEGSNHNRVGNLLAQEKKRHARVSPETPIHEVIVGNGADEIRLRRLGRHVMRLPRKLQPAEVRELNYRLRALGTQSIPMPKGPLPRNLRIPRGGGFPGR